MFTLFGVAPMILGIRSMFNGGSGSEKTSRPGDTDDQESQPSTSHRLYGLDAGALSPVASKGIIHRCVVPQTSIVHKRVTFADEYSEVEAPKEEPTDIVKGFNLGTTLGKGSFGTVYAATRLKDGLQVALKIVKSSNSILKVSNGYRKPLPKEVALHHLAYSSLEVPEILQLLDWRIEPIRYIMVLEHLVAYQKLSEILIHKGPVQEDMARVIMSQVAFAAQICCQHGVFHSNIQPKNVLIHPETLQCKLFDFGSGEFRTFTGYRRFAGEDNCIPPEFQKEGKYQAEPVTVWLLGALLFDMVLRKHSRKDLLGVKKVIQSCNNLSEECRQFLCSCLRKNAKKRMELKTLHRHKWFKLPTNPRTTRAQTSTRLGELFQ